MSFDFNISRYQGCLSGMNLYLKDLPKPHDNKTYFFTQSYVIPQGHIGFPNHNNPDSCTLNRVVDQKFEFLVNGKISNT